MSVKDDLAHILYNTLMDLTQRNLCFIDLIWLQVDQMNTQILVSIQFLYPD